MPPKSITQSQKKKHIDEVEIGSSSSNNSSFLTIMMTKIERMSNED